MNIVFQLEIMSNNTVVIPGCESATTTSSKTLSATLRCPNVTISVKKAMEAIPGSTIRYGINFNVYNQRQKWLVLPPIEINCSCDSKPDYYQMLRDAAAEVTVETENMDYCGINGSGFCPSPDWKDAEPPPADPYHSEGSFTPGIGLLPPVPPWNTK